MGFTVISPGPLTTVQDLGRFGYQSIGFAPSGVMDYRAAVLANLLVGNSKEEAVLEATLLPPMLEFHTGNVIAITGGDFEAKLNEIPILPYQAISVKAGDTLQFGMPKNGCRCYIAFAGGMDIKKVMGSCSLNNRCQIGGIEGRKLKAMDQIGFKNPVPFLSYMKRRNLLEERKKALEGNTSKILRVVCGMQKDRITKEGIKTFFKAPYSVTNESDRMGYRLCGEKISVKEKADIVSDGIVLGAIQIPSSGQPIIMLCDRQTTGGYVKLGAVCFVDIAKIAQAKMGDVFHFQKISLRKAQKLYRKEEKEFEKLQWMVES